MNKINEGSIVKCHVDVLAQTYYWYNAITHDFSSRPVQANSTTEHGYTHPETTVTRLRSFAVGIPRAHVKGRRRVEAVTSLRDERVETPQQSRQHNSSVSAT